MMSKCNKLENELIFLCEGLKDRMSYKVRTGLTTCYCVIVHFSFTRNHKHQQDPWFYHHRNEASLCHRMKFTSLQFSSGQKQCASSEVCLQIHLDELLGQLILVKCPEARVQGLIDTLPSSLLRADSIKSVSMGICLHKKPVRWLTCLLAS